MRYLARRLSAAALTILMIVILNFFLFRAMPGSPERVLFRNPNVTPELLAAKRRRASTRYRSRCEPNCGAP